MADIKMTIATIAFTMLIVLPISFDRCQDCRCHFHFALSIAHHISHSSREVQRIFTLPHVWFFGSSNKRFFSLFLFLLVSSFVTSSSFANCGWAAPTFTVNSFSQGFSSSSSNCPSTLVVKLRVDLADSTIAPVPFEWSNIS